MKLLKRCLIIIIFISLTTASVLFGIVIYRNSSVTAGNQNNITPAASDTTKNEPAIKLPENNTGTATVKRPVFDVIADCLPSKYKLEWNIVENDRIEPNYVRGYEISLEDWDKYNSIDGVTCFRGNNYRNSASFGTADIKEKKLEKLWWTKISFIDTWTGVGWTGQPAIIKWPSDLRSKMNLLPEKKQKSNLKEVIYAALDGNIYFLDMDDGQYTRQSINTGVPYKGSVMVDPRGYPLLFAGQGIDEVGGKKVDIGFRIFSLLDQKQLFFLNGLDPYTYRMWGAFDSGGIIDKKSDTLIQCGENGILYTIKLNTAYEPGNGSISIKPDVTRYRYKSPLEPRLGIENSPAIYMNYIYFTDNSGFLHCVDLNTLKPVWTRNVTDDTDSSVAIDAVNDYDVSLYTGCEVDLQDANPGLSYIRKINAFTGALQWEKAYKCVYNVDTNGGVLASPVVGRNDIENLVIFNIARTENNPRGGKLIAFDKKTGNEIWVINLDFYCWSSPVDVYDTSGKAYLVVCDSGGNMMLIEGKTGKILDKINLEGNIEGSPAVYENTVVVGTRGQKIWGIKIK